jgi:uncharacterized protein
MIIDKDGNEYVVFDDHTHSGVRPNTPLLSPYGNAFSDSQMIANMDANGVDTVVTFPLANPHTDYRVENERLIGYMQAHPDRIVAFARIQPFFGERAVADVADYASRGVRGLKFHPFMDGGANPVNNRELMFPLMAEASKHDLVVLIHSGETWNSAPSLIGDLADNFPKVQFIIGHSGLWEFHQDAIVTARRCPNVWLDTAEVAPPGVIRGLADAVGAHRILYGSDHPLIPFGWEIGKVMKYTGLPPADLRKIMGENLAKLLSFPLKPATGKVKLMSI